VAAGLDGAFASFSAAPARAGCGAQRPAAWRRRPTPLPDWMPYNTAKTAGALSPRLRKGHPYPEELMPTPHSWLLALPVLALAGVLWAAPAAEDHPVVALVKSKVKDPAKPFALLVTIKVKAGKQKELETTFAPCIAATKKEPGCLAYELNHDPDEPTSYLMFEKFKNVAALEAHLKAEHTTRLLKALEGLIDGEIKGKVYVVPE
jgi:quinol monooxygenase YgiN